MTDRKEPNERKRPELTAEDWQAAVTWRPYLYQLIRKFGVKVMGMDVWLTGDVMKNTHRWITSAMGAYGVDAPSVLEDMEARAFEAAAVAAHNFDESEGYQFSTYLTRVVNNQLQDEFDRWVKTSTSKPEDGNLQWSEMKRRFEPDGPQNDTLSGADSEAWDPQYEKTANPHEALAEETVLTPEVQERLSSAMGALSSKEAWALRMHADDVPADVISERLGYKDPKSVYRLIEKAKKKAREAYDDH